MKLFLTFTFWIFLLWTLQCKNENKKINFCPWKQNIQPSSIFLTSLSYPYGPKLKIHVGNCAEEHSVISSLCLVILIRGSLALQCRLVCLRKCSVSSVISSGVPSWLPLLLPGMSLISTPLVVSVPSVPPPPPLSRGVRVWEWGWLQLVVARLEKSNKKLGQLFCQNLI